MPARRLLSLALLLLALGLAVGGPPAQAQADEGPVALAQARLELRELANALRTARSVNDEMLALLDVVDHAFHNLEAPPTPAFEDIPVGALPEVVRAIQRRNQTLARRHAADMRTFERNRDLFQGAAAKQFIKALQLVKIQGGKGGPNVREPVNIKAAQILGGVPSERAAAGLIRAIQASIVDADHRVSSELTGEAFAALGHQGHESSLVWLVDEFTHTKNSPPKAVDQLVAAHRSMLLFPYEDLSGRGRFNTVKGLITQYAGVESTAQKSGSSAADRSAKELWDRIRDGVIQALQYYADSPKNDDGEVLATVHDFQRWLRTHRDLRASPWSD